MATKLKIIETNEGARLSAPEGVVADIVAPPKLPESPGHHGSVSQRNHPGDDATERSTSVGMDFTPAPTRNRHAGWTAEKQRKFIEHLALTGNAGEACALVGFASSSAYRLKHKVGAESFSRAWDAALRLCPTRLAAIGLDRAVNGRVERFYKNGELVMERRIPSDYLLTWFLARLDPLQFGSPSAKALAAATGDPREKARNDLPGLVASFEDVAPDECEAEPIDFLDPRVGETGSGEPIDDADR